MASEEMGLVSTRRVENGLNSNSQLVFHETFSCGPPPPPRRCAAAVSGDPGPKTTRELTGFIDKYDNNHHHHHYFTHQQQAADFRRQMFADDRGGDGSEDDDLDDDEDDGDNDDENEAEGIVIVENSNTTTTTTTNNNNSDKVNNNCSSKIGSEKPKTLSAFEGAKESGNEGNIHARNAVTIASVDGEVYYNSQYLQGGEGSNAGPKEMGFENGCGFSGRKEGCYSSESGESLRAILSDPIMGALMDDAMILPCGHSFGSGGVQHVIRMKACYICSHVVSEDSVAPNLSLRAAVQAFRREEESQLNRSFKRRKERYDQDRGTFGDSPLSDHLRGRGVQFPFAVTDRVIIKGNKRTPQRFVGREAVVTTQCLNGWYVVKTLDNAESVKLQYRSLAKVSGNLSIQPISSKTAANWL
ncbi:U-box domain-containing protein 62 isoform X3 [Nicotiana tomentosiformis]|uniref:U-box domain-containing protein 62 isoform X3 n=1 Tax=Nicotiana tomentosiformis TaxID=4098 RepID=UPI00051B016C|nr:U-box domain-containing protein 62 isoform X1 [Nicotiana tomentosiformis]